MKFRFSHVWLMCLLQVWRGFWGNHNQWYSNCIIIYSSSPTWKKRGWVGIASLTNQSFLARPFWVCAYLPHLMMVTTTKCMCFSKKHQATVSMKLLDYGLLFKPKLCYHPKFSFVSSKPSCIAGSISIALQQFKPCLAKRKTLPPFINEVILTRNHGWPSESPEQI